MHALINELIGEIRLSDRKVIFPVKKQDIALTSVDYLKFIQLVSLKFIKSETNDILDEMVINCFDNAALVGLIALNETIPNLPFKALTLDLKDIKLDNTQLFVNQFKEMLMVMSNNNLQQLNLKDANGILSKKVLVELKQIIIEKKIAIDIKLPESYQSSLIQKEIDESTSDNVRNRRIELMTQIAKKVPALELVHEKRTRVNLGKQTAQADIELQQEQQVEVAVEASQEKNNEIDMDGDEPPLIYDVDKFSNEVDQGLFNNKAKDFFERPALFSWIKWVGALGVMETKINNPLAISKKAIEELMRNDGKFQYGLDLNRLPAGFSMKTDPDNPNRKFIDFSFKKQLSAKRDPLQIQKHQAIILQVMPTSLFNKYIESLDNKSPFKLSYVELNKSNTYDRDVHKTLKQFLPQIVSLSNEDQKILFDICKDDNEHLSSEKLNFILNNVDCEMDKKINDLFSNDDIKATQLISKLKASDFKNAGVDKLLSKITESDPKAIISILKLRETIEDISSPALLQLYIKSGSAGIEQLITVINLNKENSEIFKNVFENSNNYAELLGSDIQSVIGSIAEFYKNPTDKIWFKTLLKQHCESNSNINMFDMVDAFKTFKKELKKIAPSGKQALLLPAKCNLTGVQSLPTALSRIITLLKHVEPEYRHSQMLEVPNLDLSGSGMIKVINDATPWAFVSSEMLLSNKDHDGELNYDMTGYNKFKDYPISRERQEMARVFFRNVSSQGKGNQLSLNFYKHANAKVNNCNLPVSEDLNKKVSNLRLMLLQLVVKSSTGVENVAFVKDEAQAIQEVDKMVDAIINVKLPMNIPITDSMKLNLQTDMVRALYNLKQPPPLPVSATLLLLITNCIKGVSIAAKGAKIKQATKDLDRSVTKYGHSIYVGMNDYTDKDYKKINIFFEHMKVINFLDESYDNDSINHKQVQQLAKLTSTFHLDSENLQELINDPFFEANLSDENDPKQDKVFDILKYISFKDSGIYRPLSSRDLAEILKQVKQSDKSVKVIDVIKSIIFDDGQKLEGYFNKEILHTLGKPGVPDATQRKISESFDTAQAKQISSMLLNFSATGDNLEYDKVVDLVIDVINKSNLAMGAVEKNIFIAKLCSCQNLYVNSTPLEDVDNPFIVMLQTISRQNLSVDFLSIVESEKSLLKGFLNIINKLAPEQVVDVENKEKKPVNIGLSEKIIVYMQKINPAIKNMPDKSFSQLEIQPLAHKTLLITPVEQLSASYKISLLLPLYKKQNESLKQLINDFSDDRELNIFLNEPKNLEEMIPIDFDKYFEELEVFIKDTDRATNKNDPFVVQAEKIKQLKSNDATISIQQTQALLKNPSLVHLIRYMTNDMNASEKKVFMELHEETFKKVVKNNSQLFEMDKKGKPKLKNDKYLITILNNPCLLKEFSKDECINASGSIDLLEDPDKLEKILVAIGGDLKITADFVESTKNLSDNVLGKEIEYQSSYSTSFEIVFKKINSIAKENPSSKKEFLELYDSYLESYDAKSGVSLLDYLVLFVDVIENNFQKIDDKTAVLALCFNFNSDSLQPKDLKFFFEQLEKVNVFVEPQDQQVIAPAASKKLQSTLLNIAVIMLDNDKGYSRQNFNILSQLAKSKPEFAELLLTMYDKAPYPSMEQVLSFDREASKKSPQEYKKSIKFEYQKFDIKPCSRELFADPPNNTKPLNGFHAQVAKEKLKNFKGFDSKLIDLNSFENETKVMRGLPSKELLKIFNKYSPSSETYDEELAKNDDRLVAVAAELFYRSKGVESNDYGSSMEIHTTQYLAILSSLKSPGHVTSQIGTGEGKSRIMMISIACQNAKGKTVDFVTSDAQLAKRDFVEYQAYFKMIGAKTSMIFAGTPSTDYQKGGINFSDPSNLSLFRNKAKSSGAGNDVIDPDESNRALLLDEADKTFFDVADTRFNFSKEGDESIQNMQWIYPYLIEYFEPAGGGNDEENKASQELRMASYYEDVDKCRESFVSFVKSKITEPQKINRLLALSDSQVEQWQVSAITALGLEYNEDFAIEPDALISTATDPKIASEAQLLFANRVLKSSKFSFGVHQCLHARLNRYKETPSLIKGKNANKVNDFKDKLLKCDATFNLEDEKQIVYSSTSKNLIDDYKEGTLIGVTGTAGSAIERAEASKLYGADSIGMSFIDVPRDKGLNRIDNSMRLTSNEKQQFKTLIQQIRVAIDKNQPILVIAESDAESKILFKKLLKEFGKSSSEQKYLDKIQNIHSQLSSQDEKVLTNKAGISGMITVSTDMIGRGTDIKLEGKSKDSGLNVMLTYLPRERDVEQIVGRSGRKGAIGETSLVIDKQRLKTRLGMSKNESLPSSYFNRVEAFIARRLAKIDRDKQVERIIKNEIGDYRIKFTNDIFKNLNNNISLDDKKRVLPIWTKFFDKSDKLWNETLPQIQAILKSDEIGENETSEINKLLKGYQSKVNQDWQSLTNSVQGLDIKIKDVDNKKINAVDLLMQQLPELKLSQNSIKILTAFKLENYSLNKVKIYERYDRGHDGRAISYSHWSIPAIASLKGFANLIPFVNFKNARPPFANFRASWNGRGQMFPNLRAIWNKGFNRNAKKIGDDEFPRLTPEIEVDKDVAPPALDAEIDAAPPALGAEIDVAPPALGAEIDVAPPALGAEIDVAPPALDAEIDVAPISKQGLNEDKASIFKKKLKSIRDNSAHNCDDSLEQESDSIDGQHP